MMLKINDATYLSLEDLPNEEWRDIKDFEGLYQVSNYGRVKSLTKIAKHNNRCYSTRILRAHVNTKKYLDVDLCKNGIGKRYRIHRLVAEAFIPNPNNKPQVNHIDCNKHNNKVDNLEWCDNSENQIHAFANGLNYRKKGAESPKAKAVLQMDMNDNIIKRWGCIMDIKRALGYCDSAISGCCKGKYKTMYGYKWKYEKDVDNI